MAGLSDGVRIGAAKPKYEMLPSPMTARPLRQNAHTPVDRRALLSHVVRSQTSAAVLTLASLGVVVLLTRSTSVETFGQYTILIATVTTFMRFAGLNVYFFYRNRYPTASHPEALAILRGYLPVVLLLGLGIAAILVLLDLLIGFAPLTRGIDYVLWVSLAMLSLLNLELMRFYQSIGRNVFSNWLGTAPRVASMVLLGLCMLALAGRLELRTIMMVLVLAQIVPLLVQIASDPAFLRIFTVRGNRFDRKAIFAGVLIIPTALFYDSLVLFDRFALADHLSYEAAGHYGLASQMVMIGYAILGGSLITMFYPRLVCARTTGQGQDMRALLKLAFLTGGGAGILGMVAILTLGGLVPVVFGPAYAESVDIVRAMCLVPLALFVMSGLAHVAYLFDDLRWSVAAFIVGTLECGFLNYVLVARAGVSGAIAALYITLLSVILMHVLILARRSSGARRELFQ